MGSLLLGSLWLESFRVEALQLILVVDLDTVGVGDYGRLMNEVVAVFSWHLHIPRC